MNGLAMESFDLRHAIIPFSLLQISNHYRKMQPGEAMEIVGSDAGIIHSVKSVLPDCRCEIVPDEAQGFERNKILIRVIKQGPSKKGGQTCQKSI
jgi:TusA-related sulfurtransferase